MVGEDVFVNDFTKCRADRTARCPADHGLHENSGGMGKEQTARQAREDAERGHNARQCAQGTSGLAADIAALNARAMAARTDQGLHLFGSLRCGKHHAAWACAFGMDAWPGSFERLPGAPGQAEAQRRAGYEDDRERREVVQGGVVGNHDFSFLGAVTTALARQS